MDIPVQYKLRSGLEADLPAIAPMGEPFWTKDTHKLFMGTDDAIVQVGGGSGGGAGYAGEKEITVPYTVDIVADKGKLLVVTNGGTGVVNFPSATDPTFFCYVKNEQGTGNNVTFDSDDDNGFDQSVTLTGGQKQAILVVAGNEVDYAGWYALFAPPTAYQDILGYTLLSDFNGYTYNLRVPDDYLYLLKANYTGGDLVINLPGPSETPQNFRFRVSNESTAGRRVILTLLHPESGEIFGDPSSVTTVTIKPGNGGEVFCNATGGDWYYVGGLADYTATTPAYVAAAISTAVSAEATARANADAVLASAIVAEATARASADTALQASIDSHVVSFKVNGNETDSQISVNFIDSGLLQIIDDGGGDIRWDTTGIQTALDALQADIDAFVFPQTKAFASNKFLTAYDATTGVFTAAQPDFADLSGTATVAQVPALPASKITSGQIALARGGTGVDLSAGGSSTAFLAQDASHVISARSLVAADVPSLDAAKITTGQIALARGGTNADLSATGGANQFLKQSGVGSAVTVAAILAADVPSLDAGKITTGQIALARGGTGADLSASGGSTAFLAQAADHTVSARSIIAADVPALDAGKITTGQLALARGGTGVDLSTTGGLTFVLAQDAAHVISARALVAGDLPNHSAALITSGSLALARGGTNADLSASGSSTAFLAQDASHVVTARAIVAADVPALDAGKITTGQIALARGGTGVDLSATGGTTFVLAQDAAHVISARALVAADIPNLAASIITSGQLALARGGTHADLSATGGANQFLKQTSAGGDVTVAAIVAADLASGVLTWDKLGNAAGALTLANGSSATTFNQTSAATWLWANTTAATAGGVTSSSPIQKLGAQIFTGGANTQVTWNMQVVPNPTTALSFAITNMSENSSSDVVITIGTHTLVLGNVVTISGLSNFTWMNGQTCYVTAVAATTITVRDATTHGTQASAAATGTCTQQPITELVFTTSGVPTATDSIAHTAGEQRLIFPLAGGFGNGNTGIGSFAFAGQSAFVGYGPLLSTGGLAIYTNNSPSGTPWLSLYDRATAASNHIPFVLGSLTYGNNSAGNSTIGLQAVQTNFSLSLSGGNTTNTTNPCVHIGNIGSLTATSGAQIGVGIGVPNGQGSPIITFAPTSGTATFEACELRYTINQTGGANGASQGFKIKAVETAVGGNHKIIDVFAGSTGVTEIWSLDNGGVETSYTPNGAQWIFGSASELITLSTSGTTTDSVANLLPANAIIESVVARVTTTITTATNWKMGDATTAGRFTAANSTLTAGTTDIGLVHVDQTGSAGPRQTAAAKVRITTTGTPGAGVVRVTVFYRQFVAPTS